MPPFGNLYGQEVFVSDTLAKDEEIAFNLRKELSAGRPLDEQ